MLGYSTVTTKGQVTIPVSIRNALNLAPSVRVMIVQRGNDVIVQRAPDITSLRGSVTPRTKPENFDEMRRQFIKHLGTRTHQ